MNAPTLIRTCSVWRALEVVGDTPILLTPRSTEEVARAVAICAREGVAITPQGGGTGLVGGQVPFGEVLLSIRKMRAVRDVTIPGEARVVAISRGGRTWLPTAGDAFEAGDRLHLAVAATSVDRLKALLSPT